MTRIAISLVVLAIAIAGLAMTVRAQQDADSQPAPVQVPQAQTEPTMPTCKPDTLLVKVNPGADPAEVVGRHGGSIVQTITGIDVQVVAVPAGTGMQKVQEYSADPDVKYAEPNQIVRAVQAGDGAGGGAAGSGC